MDIAFYRCKYDGSLFLLYLALGVHLCLDDLKGYFCRFRAHEKLREEDGSLLKSLSYPVQGRNHLVIDDCQGFLFLQKRGDRLMGRILQPPLNGRGQGAVRAFPCCGSPAFSYGLSQTGGLAAVYTDVLAALGIPVHKGVEAVECPHHGFRIRIDDGCV